VQVTAKLDDAKEQGDIEAKKSEERGAEVHLLCKCPAFVV
jgi:hypothetical protein